jgi:outer membrane translocation and assembly module TamA
VGDSIGGVLFHDAGNVYSSLADVSTRVKQRDVKDFNYMVHAIGVGVRVKSPVGPVRFDLGYVPNSPRFQFLRTPEMGGPDELVQQRISRLQFHFSLGQTF